MDYKDKIVKYLSKFREGRRSSEIAMFLRLSRPTVLKYLKDLELANRIEKFENGPKTWYSLVENTRKALKTDIVYHQTYSSEGLREEDAYDEVNVRYLKKIKLPEKTSSIIRHAFLEMLNNAIEHSHSRRIYIEFSVDRKNNIEFLIRDWGIGVFRSIQNKLKHHSELEAAQDILKGKLTTDPQNHSGEGIFFTSKVADFFGLHSFKQALVVNNRKHDVQILPAQKLLRGTSVVFSININTHKHLTDIFKRFTEKGDYGFSTTEVHVKLFTMFSHHVSRSQARRVLDGLEKFSHIIMDFNGVKTVGQAFADQIFRVFIDKHPNIKITPINMNEEVSFMINRAKNNLV